ncbi:DUF551 domain-containing protein [Candidatus Pacearchaeota archaeon]|nr:DUF551 domain-containing protein [Candidatus Pacearchaeota archaeon]
MENPIGSPKCSKCGEKWWLGHECKLVPFNEVLCGQMAEWISVKEKLPEEAPVLVRYIGQFFGEPDPRIDIGYYDNPKDYENPDDGQGWLFWRNEQPITVTHWMKLPELPKAA